MGMAGLIWRSSGRCLKSEIAFQRIKLHRYKYKRLKNKNKYAALYSKHKHHVGSFNLWDVEAIIDPSKNCFQRQRAKFLPQSAKNDLSLYFSNGVFKQAAEGVEKYCCNITLMHRPQAKEERFQIDQIKICKSIKKIPRTRPRKKTPQPPTMTNQKPQKNEFSSD